MRAEIDFAGRELLGARENQEDFYAFEELASGGLLLVLADGVGGESNGELASRAAVYGFLEGFAGSKEAESRRFPAALRQANEGVARVIDEGPGGEIEMATTLLALTVEGGEARWLSVGDSPLLLFRAGELRRLNEDHSGKAERHPEGLGRNALSSALTGGRIARVDAPEPCSLEANDLLLAASDGLWTLSFAEVGRYLAGCAEEGAAQIAEGLLRCVREREKPSQDNVTVAVIKARAAIKPQ